MLPRRGEPVWLRYSVAIAAVLIAFGVSRLIGPLSGGRPGPHYMAAVAVSAWYGGLGPGLLTTVAAAAIGYFEIHPGGSVIPTRPEDGLFLLSALVISSLGGRMRDAYLRAQAARIVALNAGVQTEHAERRLAGIVASAMDAIITVDGNQRIVVFNAAAERMFRCPTAEAIGGPLDRFIPERFRAAHADDVRRFGETGTTSRAMGALRPLAALRTDGEEFPIEATISQAQTNGQKLFNVIIRDISERQALERMQREFIAMAGHELRNPLTAIRGAAQLMQRRGVYSERRVETIVNQTRRLERLVDDLLDISRLEAGRLELRPARVDLAQLVHASAEQVRAISPAHVVRVEVAPGPIEGWWDPDRLGQVLQNLLMNAVKYSPDGGEVLVRLETQDSEVRLSISDRGVGIPAEALSRLFDRFYRAENAAAGSQQGFGLGLYIARSLVEAHGGRIWAESAGPGQGSTFTVALPRTGVTGQGSGVGD